MDLFAALPKAIEIIEKKGKKRYTKETAESKS